MKFLLAGLASLTLTSAIAAPKKVSYDGWKTYRINVGSDRAALKETVETLKLGTWKGSVDTSDIVDVVVPPTQIKEFQAKAQSFKATVMHEDLGASIAEEADFGVYASGGVTGKYVPQPCSASYTESLRHIHIIYHFSLDFVFD